MSDLGPDRRDDLVAAALADDLTPSDAAELDALRATDPSIDEELADLRALAARVAELPPWEEPGPTDLLGRRIRRAVRRAEGGPRRGLLLSAAAGLAVGALGGLAAPRPTPEAPTGEPGTLGAHEPVTFVPGEAGPEGLDVSGEVVAHTWGTETLLHVEGLRTGEVYLVVAVGRDGREIGSGSLLGSDVGIDCAVNAAALRQDVSSVEIREDDGDLVARADLPEVGA